MEWNGVAEQQTVNEEGTGSVNKSGNYASKCVQEDRSESTKTEGLLVVASEMPRFHSRSTGSDSERKGLGK